MTTIRQGAGVQDTSISFQPPLGTLAGILVAGLMLFAAITYSAHAIERHGSAAVRVRQCLNDKPPLETWTNPVTGRNAHVCQVDKGLFGIQIEKDGNEITSFIKEKMRTIEQVRKYLTNGGYSSG